MSFITQNPTGYSIEKWDNQAFILHAIEFLFNQVKCTNEQQFSHTLIEDRKREGKLPALVADRFMQSTVFPTLTSDNNLLDFSASLLGCPVKDVVVAFPHFRLDLPTAFSQDQVRLNLPWHQEAGYFLEQGNCCEDSLVISTPLFDCSEADGALVVGPYSHAQGLINHKSVFMDANNQRHKRAICPPPKEFEVLETKQGESQVINFLTVHRSGINRNPKVRCTLLFRISNINDL